MEGERSSPPPVRGVFIHSAVMAEVKRAKRDGRPINRNYLRDETGLAWNRLEALISQASMALDSALDIGADGDADRRPTRQVPTPGRKLGVRSASPTPFPRLKSFSRLIRARGTP